MKHWRQPLDREEVVVPRGAVHVRRERCKDCGICIAFCPEKVLERSEEMNAKGYHPPQVKAGARCVNCRFCEALCPDFAIFSTEIPGPAPSSAPPKGPSEEGHRS